ncbi:MAG TPA: hypothetical protein VGI39_32475 [Polyangiaceae bacterium]|jgi:hypothetical protein
MKLPRPSAPLASLVFTAAALLFASPAHAITDAHFTGDDVTVTVDEAGLARIEHAVGYRFSGGAPKGFDLNGIEPEATIDPSAPVVLDGQVTNAAHVEARGRGLHVTLDGLLRSEKRGVLVVRVRYAVDLIKTRELSVDGVMWRLGWTSPVASEGFDAARVVFDLPGAPTEPTAIDAEGESAGVLPARRPIASDGTTGEDGRVVTLQREPLRDRLEMERPHVARGEAALWLARVDPRAFPRVQDPSMRPAAPSAELTAPAGRSYRALLVAALVGLLFGALSWRKSRAFAQACRGARVKARGLVPRLSPVVRALVAGSAFASAVALEIADRPSRAALALVVAMVLVAHRAPEAPFVPRGPGHWMPLSPSEAFARERVSDPLDAFTASGRVTLALATLASIALGFALSRFDRIWGALVPLDALALLPLFATGSYAQLPPDRARAPKKLLAALHRAFKRVPSIRVAPWARVPVGATQPDELRLLVLPRAPMPGVVGIEVGVAWLPTPVGYAPETEVLVRVRDDSAAAARLSLLAPRRRPVPGRKPDERVLRLVPALGLRSGALALVQRLAFELHDRRKSLPAVKWAGAERRLPPNERLRTPAAA